MDENKEKTPVVFARRDALALFMALGLSLLFFAVFFPARAALLALPGLGAALFVWAVIGASLLYLGRDAHWDRDTIFLTAVTALLALQCALYGNESLRVISFLLLLGLTPLTVFALSGRAHRHWYEPGAVGETIKLFFVCLFRYVPAPFRALGQAAGTGRRKLLYVLLGLCAALPVAAVATALLTSADAVFAGVFSGLGEWLRGLRPGPALLRLMGWLLFFSALYFLCQPNGERPAEREKRILPALPFVTALAVLDLLYAAFGAVQVVYLFGGAETAAMQGGYAAYARTGFFQLAAVAALNLLVLGLSVSATGGKSRALRVFSLLLLGLTAVILASAVLRMSLYIGAFGLSVLRLLTLWGMAVVALLLLAAGYKLYRPEFRLWRAFIALGLCAWLLLGFVNADARVAEYNVDAYLAGRLESVDTDYLSGLSPDVLPALERLAAETEDGALSAAARESAARLRHRAGETLPWQTWTLAAARAGEKTLNR